MQKINGRAYVSVAIVSLTLFMMNGLAHHYHLGESTFILMGVGRDFKILFNFAMKFPSANRIDPDGKCGLTSGAILFAYVP